MGPVKGPEHDVLGGENAATWGDEVGQWNLEMGAMFSLSTNTSISKTKARTTRWTFQQKKASKCPFWLKIAQPDFSVQVNSHTFYK